MKSKYDGILIFFAILCGLLAILNGYFTYIDHSTISVVATVTNVVACVLCTVAYMIRT